MPDLDLAVIRQRAEAAKGWSVTGVDLTTDAIEQRGTEVRQMVYDDIPALLDRLERAERATDGQGCTECAAEVGVHVGADTGLCAGHVAILYDRVERTERELERAEGYAERLEGDVARARKALG